MTIKLDEQSKRTFRLSILSNETVIESLYFHKTDGLLARSETPVYLTDRDSLKKMCGAKIYKDYKFVKTSFEEVPKSLFNIFLIIKFYIKFLYFSMFQKWVILDFITIITERHHWLYFLKRLLYNW